MLQKWFVEVLKYNNINKTGMYLTLFNVRYLIDIQSSGTCPVHHQVLYQYMLLSKLSFAKTVYIIIMMK